ncbi:type IV secretory pathway VirB4 components-like protein (plasmid) [Thioalkalivibrio sp. K90mix]|uniref:VirB4 family type IV secretion system protein n=1 Tax=Thioalkalivibrio sp. (strain K90mix) TaxID=396595 RepID=UPI000195A7B1|nr:type IV secretory pathway VirB4 components-like protein [Thioalkalivibrio sp. K90mix]ADC73306.1 type IV secretory pathway VirB4 components-like protein [Thioalkalivibrio sp. K90mix]
MLNVSKTRPDQDYQQTHRPLAELLPWMALITDGCVMNKDGSVLVMFEHEGFDREGVDALEINTLVERIESAMVVLDETCTLWWTTQRREIDPDPGVRSFDNPIADYVDRAWVKNLHSRRAYKHRNYLAISFANVKGSSRFFDLYAKATADGMPALKALMQAATIALQSKDRLLFEAEEVTHWIDKIENTVDQFTASLKTLQLRRLKGKELLAVLHRTVSPSSKQKLVAPDPDQAYLDSYLGEDAVTVHPRYLKFSGHKNRYAATASVKSWPHYSTPGIFDSIQKADAELDFTVAFRVQSKESARGYIEDVRRHNANFAKSLFGYAKEAFTQSDTATIDNTRLIQSEEADDALTDLGAGGSAGYLLATLTVYAQSPKHLERDYNETMKLLHEAEFVLMRETIHLLSAWCGHIPGQMKEPVRWMFVSGRNYADSIPLRAIRTGSRTNHYLTQQRGEETGALTALETEHRIPYFFNFHETDLPHGFVIGPSRAGKSVFMMFLASQWNRYAPSQVFIFDKDLTCRIPTYLHDGKYLWLGKENTAMNPLSQLDSEEDLTWFASWVETLIESRGYQIKAEDEKLIWQAGKEVMALKEAGETVTLSSFALHLPVHLAEELEPWVGDGGKASMFDNEEDALSLADWTAMEMGQLFNDERAARAFMDYAFYRIYQRLDGRPTLIYIEEAWFMLADERFAAKVNDWLRTLAKKNATLIMATQSLEELAQSSAFVSMVDNIPNRIFLSNANARASKELYTKRFGLTDAQVERIRTMTPKMQYYICTPKASRMVEAQFPPHVLAYLRSDAKAQKVFNMARESHPEKWKEVYHDRMQEEI